MGRERKRDNELMGRDRKRDNELIVLCRVFELEKIWTTRER